MVLLPATILHPLFRPYGTDIYPYHGFAQITGDFGQHCGIIEIGGCGDNSLGPLSGITRLEDA
jgi:hypothetical protein